MAVLAVVTSSPPDVEGGHLVIARALVTAARDAGHDARLVLIADNGFGRLTSSYWAAWRTNVHRIDGRQVDQVISLRYPSYAVRHPKHVCWLNHTMREYYDLWPRLTASISPANRVKERVRKTLVHAADRWLLTKNVTSVVAQSQTIQRRLAHDFGLSADVLRPPPPPRAYRCDGYGDYIFTASRLTPLKRIDLMLRALAEPQASNVRLVIAGDGDERNNLQRLAVHLGVANRVQLLGHIDDDTLIDRFARCRAVCFTPFAEDYGFVTVESFASAKAVVTCSDSGGPAELVRHERTGFVCEPTASALANALGTITVDSTLAERLGSAAAADVATMTWSAALKRLVDV